MDGQVDEAGALDALTEPVDSAMTSLTGAAEEPQGEQYLLFWLSEWPCLVRLADLREALPNVPRHVALPFSPRWLWGIFPLRTDIVALVDPVPMLRYGPDAPRDASAERRSVAAPRGVFGQVEPLRALVVGEGDHLLALLADRIGDICVLREEDRRPLDALEASDAAPLGQYIAEGYALAGLERVAMALRVTRLVDDVLAALEERTDDE